MKPRHSWRGVVTNVILFSKFYITTRYVFFSVEGDKKNIELNNRMFT